MGEPWQDRQAVPAGAQKYTWPTIEVVPTVDVLGKLVGREELLREVWGPAYAKETHYLRVYLAQLRRKLETDPAHPVHLLTEAGMGYRFQE